MKSVETNHELRSGLSARGLCRGAAALLLGAAALLLGCSKDTPDTPPGIGPVEGARVTLSFSSEGPLHAVDKGAAARAGAAFASGTASASVCAAGADAHSAAGAATREVLNPSAVDEWAVADMWVLQYDMSGGAGGSLAARRYVASAVQDGANVRVTADLEPMEKARIVVLANAPGSFSESVLPTGSTLADLAALTFPVNATGGNSVPDDYSFALPMRGESTDMKLEMGQVATVRMPLYRLVSKVNFTVDNRCAEGYPRLTLTGVSLRNVPAVGCYARVTEATHASTRYPAAASGNFKDYEALSEGLGTQCELLWYLAPNSRGTGSGTKPADKTSMNAPQGQGAYCTYAYVQGMIQTEAEGPLIPMNYRVYLGGNATNDYNVWANEAYRVKLTIWELPEDPEAEVGHDGFTVEVSAADGFHDNTVEGWDTRPPVVGNLYGGGVIYWVDPDDAANFRVVALDQAPSTLAWAASTGYVLGSGAQDQTARNGADVWKLALASSEGKLSGESGVFATDYPAFDYCFNKTDGGVSKGTWYLPSIQELKDLHSAKGSVESVITANGGTALSTYCYWSASESSDYSIYAWYVYFSNGSVGSYDKTNNKYYVRCVRGK